MVATQYEAGAVLEAPAGVTPQIGPVMHHQSTPSGETVTIPLTQGQVAVIDAEDAERVLAHRWYASWTRHTFYARRTVKGKKIYLHRFIMQPPDSSVFVDHIDGDGLNCTRANMRLVTSAQNQQNRTRPRTGGCGFIGVCWDKNAKCWVADVRKDGQNIRVGRFSSAKAAAIARDRVALELFGDYAGLNFPDLLDTGA